jgi:hypothetical protein
MKYRGTIAFDPPQRQVRSGCGTDAWRDPDHYREWKRRWREGHREHVRTYQREYMRNYKRPGRP